MPRRPVVGEVVGTVMGDALVMAIRPDNDGLFSTPFRVLEQRTGVKKWISAMAVRSVRAAGPADKVVVFLNLADVDPVGLAAKTTRALRSKGLFVVQHDVFGLLANPGAGNRDEVRADCARADKVMLGIHGMPHDVEWGYGNAVGFGGQTQPIARAIDLAALLLNVLVAVRPWSLALIMCYGARSSNYRRDHDTYLSTHDVTSSFAYRLFSLLCTRINVRMTARTGAVGFDIDQGGHSTVQQEAAVQAQIELEELRTAPRTRALVAFFNQGVQPTVGWFQRAPTRGELEGEFERVLLREMELGQAKENSAIKYGKYIYTYNAHTGRVRVVNKYANLVLYDGPLVPWSFWQKTIFVVGVVGTTIGVAMVVKKRLSK